MSQGKIGLGYLKLNFKMKSPLEDIKNYFDRRFSREEPALTAIRSSSDQAGLPPIHIPIYLGKLLYILAKMQNAKKILEIGTLAGYSTAWLAQSLPSHGKLITLEINPTYAALAQDHLQQAHLAHLVEIRVGHAVDLLAQLAHQQEGPFDLVFIDADKENHALYLDWSLNLTQTGSVILIDNLLPKGDSVGQPAHQEAEAVYSFNDYLAQHPQLEVSVIPVITRDIQRMDGLGLIYVK